MFDVYVFGDEEWAVRSAAIINQAIRDACIDRGSCNIMLTGGRSAENVYRVLAPILKSDSCLLNFYFGDERCVDLDDSESNYKMANESLFKALNTKSLQIHRIKGEDEPKKEAERYANLLPHSIDVLLLSIGEDGHIASLFPGDTVSLQDSRKMVVVNAPKRPNRRISITKNIINNSARIFCFAQGKAKGKALIPIFTGECTIEEAPAKLVKNSTWLLDTSAEAIVRQNSMLRLQINNL